MGKPSKPFSVVDTDGEFRGDLRIEFVEDANGAPKPRFLVYRPALDQWIAVDRDVYLAIAETMKVAALRDILFELQPREETFRTELLEALGGK